MYISYLLYMFPSLIFHVTFFWFFVNKGGNGGSSRRSENGHESTILYSWATLYINRDQGERQMARKLYVVIYGSLLKDLSKQANKQTRATSQRLQACAK